jgi:Ca2+-binding EF-hand superfamily protein
MTRTWIAAAAMGLASIGIASGQEYQAEQSYDRSETSQSQRYSSADFESSREDEYQDNQIEDDQFFDESRHSVQRQQEDQQSYREQQSRAFDRSPSGYDREPGTAGRDYERSYQQDSARSQNRSQTSSDQSDSIAEWLSGWWSDDQSSSAGIGASNAREFISEHDGDEDGYLAWSELPRDLRTSFNRLDRDGDGYLSQSELSQHANQAARTRVPVEVTYIWVVGADRGKVELNELQQAYRLLQRIDNDNDGYITRTELRNQQQQVVSQFINHCFDCHDKDYDDEITRSEASGTMLARGFDHLDRNSDDKLTRSELRTAMRRQTTDQQGSQGEATRLGQSSEFNQPGESAFRDEDDSRR